MLGALEAQKRHNKQFLPLRSLYFGRRHQIVPHITVLQNGMVQIKDKVKNDYVSVMREICSRWEDKGEFMQE